VEYCRSARRPTPSVKKIETNVNVDMRLLEEAKKGVEPPIKFFWLGL
jgi:hypothetical protein